MVRFNASFTNADDCDFVIGDLSKKMKISKAKITKLHHATSGDLPINYPDTPISDQSSADWLDGKEHISKGSNMLNSYVEPAYHHGVRLSFCVANANKSAANKILLSHRAYDIRSCTIQSKKSI